MIEQRVDLPQMRGGISQGVMEDIAAYNCSLIEPVNDCILAPEEVSEVCAVDEEEVVAADKLTTVQVCTLRPTDSGGWEAEDDIKGGPLQPERVMQARTEEMGYIFDRSVYKPSSRETCAEVTGRPPLRTGWSDTNKGDGQCPNYRSRFVAKDFKAARKGSVAQLFAGTPPAESLRALLSIAVSGGRAGGGPGECRGRDQFEICIIDVRRAHFYAKAIRRVFVEMPKEDPRYDQCGGSRS